MLSQFLRVAVEDSQRAEAAANVMLCMGLWWVRGPKVSTVCMAGSVMMYSLPYAEDHILPCMTTPLSYSRRDSIMLFAIDDMRMGRFHSAFNRIDPASRRDRSVLDTAAGTVKRMYKFSDGRADWKTYLEAADVLEQGGL